MVTEAERRARAAEEERQAKARKEAEERAARERLERERAEACPRRGYQQRAAEEERLAKLRAAEEERLAERRRLEAEAALKALKRERQERAAKPLPGSAPRRKPGRQPSGSVSVWRNGPPAARYSRTSSPPGAVDEFKGIAGQISAFLKKARKPKPCPPA